MRVRNTLTGREGYVKVYTWWQGYEFHVFVDDDIEVWKQEHIQILHDRRIVRTSNLKKVYKDPFEHYTENELDELWESMTGYEMTKEFLQIDRLKRIAKYIAHWYRTKCSRS
jgi:hypothetical protein